MRVSGPETVQVSTARDRERSILPRAASGAAEPGFARRRPPPRGVRLNGLVLVDKLPGPSSFDVVKRLRARYGVKAGHAGTLDPLASGLLLCLLGPSTRLARYLVGLDKRYLTEIRLGLVTTTGDGEGEIEEETEVVSREAIEALEG